jgi:hypothetical protein
MFDLDKSILEWKQSFQQGSSIDQGSIEELESHLRESVAELHRKGLNDEESFFVAINRLGQASSLKAEFTKNSPLGANQDRLIWMLSGYLGITLCGILSSAVVSSFAASMAFVGVGSIATGVVATLFQILFWIGIFYVVARSGAISFVFGKNPVLSLFAMFITMITLPFVAPLANVAQARVADPQWMMETYYWIGLGHFTVQLLIYAFCFIALFKIRNSLRNPAVSQ